MIKKTCFLVALVITSSSVFFFPHNLQANPAGEKEISSSYIELSLPSSVDMSLGSNPSIAKQRAILKGYSAHVWGKTTPFLPKLSATTAYYYYRGYTELGKIFGLGVDTTSLGVGGNYSATAEIDHVVYNINYVTANLGASYILPIGKEYGEYMAAVHALEAEEANYAAAEQDLIFRTKAAYFSILRAQKFVEVSTESLDRVNQHSSDVDNMLKRDLLSQVDVLRTKMELAKAKRHLTEARTSLKLSKANFNSLLSKDLDAEVNISDISEPPSSLKEMGYYLVAAKKNNPQLMKLEADIGQAKSEMFAAQCGYFPTIAIAANSGINSADIVSYNQFSDFDVKNQQSSLGAKWAPAYTITAIGTLDIWDWGETQSKIRESKAKVTALTETYKLIDNMVALDIRDKYYRFESELEELEESQAYLDFANENFRITQARFKEGLATTTDMIDAQNNLTQAQAQYYGTLYDMYIAKADLEKTAGIINSSI